MVGVHHSLTTIHQSQTTNKTENKMFFANIFKLLLIILFAYFVVNVFKYIFHFNRSIQQKMKNKNRNKSVNPENTRNGKIIELDKDQYKVE